MTPRRRPAEQRLEKGDSEGSPPRLTCAWGRGGFGLKTVTHLSVVPSGCSAGAAVVGVASGPQHFCCPTGQRGLLCDGLSRRNEEQRTEGLLTQYSL